MTAEYSPLLTNNTRSQANHAINQDLLAERPTQGSNFTAYVNVLCIVAGSGTLGLPYALRMGGWVGVGILILSLAMSIYTSILLIKCLYYNGTYRLSSFQEVGYHAFGRPGLIAVWFFYGTLAIGAPVMYLILAGTEMSLITGVELDPQTWIWFCAIFVGAQFVFLKTLKEVVYVSILGSLATVVLVIIVVRGSILDFDNPEYENVEHHLIIFKNLPAMFASMSVCYGGNIVFTHVEGSMRRPKDWNRVVTAALATCSILYLATAIPGYIAYGDRLKSPILDNLPKDVFTKIGATVIVLHVLFAAPIPLISVSLELERIANIKLAHHGNAMEYLYRTIIRVLLIAFCGITACTVPYFGDFLSLLGALANCSMIYVLPIVFYFKLIGWRHMRRYELAWCAAIVITGVLSAIIGSIEAIKALRDDFENDNGN
ncbi:hypothetical protein BX616_004582 [Lobosporangium transversale]|uniref:Transmembrane amino acid transporter protein-domain-containing protein n=1 Tax=Lobosporangium transversale TaxID=64571 RepID=A0A1Y2GY66_9FUNG|nr:transmembrane amino acid transporter protein-domain-containing protein [Lobosporangium transversale]KAF9916117.1 hypothetical protein BX616_004582 [Lobosporangium transversale]ORZ26754.1 transmembrane amino acid transporter protein-domain-containing protein [Lobosporangium transversale]|eukprot:XP_021884517.1 transmembrane amino acid transporter protein-domain-containing protein [Lobosporangium transversale]